MALCPLRQRIGRGSTRDDQRLVIGSSGNFETHFPAEQCAQRLNADPSAPAYTGHVERSGFELARYGRTAVRIRGSFTPSALGTRVNFRVEFIPWILWALAASYIVGVPLLIGLALRGLVPASTLALAAVITAVGLPINFWLSELQARKLKDHVTTALDTK